MKTTLIGNLTVDREFLQRWLALGRWRELPDAPLPTAWVLGQAKA